MSIKCSKDELEVSDDIIKDYFRLLENIPLLSSEEEKQYARLKNNGNLDARKILIESNLRLVISIAKKYINKGASFEDLIQAGNEGLIKAVDRFDETKGFKFSTYAVYWIKLEILRNAIDLSKAIKVPSKIIYRLIDANKLINEFALKGDKIDLYHTVLLMCKKGEMFNNLKLSIKNNIKNNNIEDKKIHYIIDELFKYDYVDFCDKNDEEITFIVINYVKRVVESLEAASITSNMLSLDLPLTSSDNDKSSLSEFVLDQDTNVEQAFMQEELVRSIKKLLNEKYVSKTIAKDYSSKEQNIILEFGMLYNKYKKLISESDEIENIKDALESLNDKVNYIYKYHTIISKYENIIDRYNLELKNYIIENKKNSLDIDKLLYNFKKRYAKINPDLLIKSDSSIINLEKEKDNYIYKVIEELKNKALLNKDDIDEIIAMLNSKSICCEFKIEYNDVNENYNLYQNAYHKLKSIDIILKRLFSDKNYTLQDVANEYSITRKRASQIELKGLDIIRKYCEETFSDDYFKYKNK